MGKEFLMQLVEPQAPKGESQLREAELLSPEQKKAVFTPAIEAMKKIGLQHGLTFPENPLSRLFIVDSATFEQELQEHGVSKNLATKLGVTFADGTALVNYTEATRVAKSHNLEANHILKAVGTHELWHMLSYTDVWTLKNTDQADPKIALRRSGIFTKYPPPSTPASHSKFQTRIQRARMREGMRNMCEGFISYLTTKTLEGMSEKLLYNPYHNELKIVNELMEHIGEDPFFKAEFTKSGYNDLVRALNKLYGKHSLSAVTRMFEDE